MGDLFAERGWQIFPPEADLARWARTALAARPPRAGDLRCGGTWDVGLDALPNDAAGTVADVALSGAVIREVQARYGTLPLHRAQLSTIHPGYPRQGGEEDDAAFRFRLRRDAAHVDGILPVGARRRRMIREPHGYILGLPLTRTSSGASLPVVWEGSHRIIRAALHAALAPYPVETWADVDVTDAYQAARREVFATCDRIVLHAEPGQAVLLHRLVLHGISPWEDGAAAPEEGRIIAYFRPECEGGIGEWLAG